MKRRGECWEAIRREQTAMVLRAVRSSKGTESVYIVELSQSPVSFT